MRILGLDYGRVTVGVAVSDPLMLTAQPVTTIKRVSETKLRRTFAEIESIIQQYGVEKIIVGFPKNMNDTLGERAQKTLGFSEKLSKRVGLPVVMWDERLITWQANEILDETGFSKNPAERKTVIDRIAAQLILQSYMEYAAGGGLDEGIVFYGKTDVNRR